MYNESLKANQSKNNISLPYSSNFTLISKKSNSGLLCEQQHLDLWEGDHLVPNVEKNGNL